MEDARGRRGAQAQGCAAPGTPYAGARRGGFPPITVRPLGASRPAGGSNRWAGGLRARLDAEDRGLGTRASEFGGPRGVRQGGQGSCPRATALGIARCSLRAPSRDPPKRQASWTPGECGMRALGPRSLGVPGSELVPGRIGCGVGAPNPRARREGAAWLLASLPPPPPRSSPVWMSACGFVGRCAPFPAEEGRTFDLSKELGRSVTREGTGTTGLNSKPVPFLCLPLLNCSR